MKSRIRLAIIGLASIGCGPVYGLDPIVVIDNVKYFRVPFGYVLTEARWPKPANIPVCWEAPSAEDGHFRAVVRQAIAETWERESRVRFTGWNACEAASPGIRIKVADGEPHVENLGIYIDAMPNGMVLNFAFGTWGRGCATKKDFCIKAVAVHEFGHALGFAHEQLQKDAPKECKAEKKGTDGDWAVTKYDLYSIMNYCNPKWLGDGMLSELDIKTIQTIYPWP